MHYCGIVPAQRVLQLALLEEVRVAEPPIGLSALFYEPGSAEELAGELSALGEVVVALGAPSAELRAHEELVARGVPAQPPHPEMARLRELLELPAFSPGGEAAGEAGEGSIPEGAYQDFPLFETNPDGVFAALGGRRLPARRHPYGMQLRIEELTDDRVSDEGGELWHRRAEEIDAAACALCAHRYAVGHASWVGDPGEGVVVLPGSSLPEEFSGRGVLPPVERLRFPRR